MFYKKEELSDVVVRKVKRREEASGTHSGAWKVAFADFVLALMSLFLVMWVLSLRDHQNLEEFVRASRGNPIWESSGTRMIDLGASSASQLIPKDAPQEQAKQTAPEQGKGDSTQKLKPRRYDNVVDMEKLAALFSELSVSAGLADNIQTVVTPFGLRVMLHDTDQHGMFERGSEVINERFKRLLEKIGDMFRAIDNQILIVGHTDSAQYKAKDYTAFSNWSLSSNRAMAARAYLLKGGMPNQNILQVVGMADRALLDAMHPEAAINRRIELLVLTSAQARAIADMFGTPRRSENILPGVKIDLPDSHAMATLNRPPSKR